MPRAKKPVEMSSGSEDEASSTRLPTIAHRWEWEGEGNKWTMYTEQQSTTITIAASNGKHSVALDAVGESKFDILIDKMVQKNKITGWERRLRVSCKENDAYYCWEWLDEKNQWHPYPFTTTLYLEHAKTSGKSTVDFMAVSRKYCVDLSKMTQNNVATNVERQVRRQKSDATVVADIKIESNMKSADVIKSSAPRPIRKSAAVPADFASAHSDDDDESKPSTSKKVNKRQTSGKKGNGLDDDEENEGEPAKKKAKRSGASAGKSEGGNNDERNTVRTVVVKGRAPVDPDCTAKVKTAHVFHEGNDIYDAMLNQTNIGNNNNKFYLMQLLEEDGRKSYSVWFRWGRVGAKGQNSLVACGPDLDEAKEVFCKKFFDKTKNEWSDRKKFKKVAGKYDIVKLDYASKEPLTGAAENKPAADKSSIVKIPESKLDKKIQISVGKDGSNTNVIVPDKSLINENSFIKLICDVKEMEDLVVEMKYDSKKAPLGRLTTEQIKAGYSALKVVDTLIQKGDLGQRLVDACSEFYTRIPHDFKMSRPPVLRTKAEVKAKLNLLEALSDIEIAMRVLQEAKSTENPIDCQYKSLKCDIDVLDHGDKTFQIIEEYLSNTHAPTHNQYKMKVLDVFTIQREAEAVQFIDHGNRMLLWHGSRLTNMVGILSSGLRIAPPEAPVTGYMFGKGIYFADMSSKSANYCFASKSKNVGLILLCEVSLGNCNELLNATYDAEKLPKGKHSVKGVGKLGPDPKHNHTCADGTVVPLGKYKDTGVTNPAGYTLNYNEYIVYNTRQVKVKYVVQVRFDFN